MIIITYYQIISQANSSISANFPLFKQLNKVCIGAWRSGNALVLMPVLFS